MIQVDAEFQSLIPPLTEDEAAGLEASLLAEGCREPLLVWAGVLVDGHNRYRICRRLGLSFQVRDITFPDRLAARVWIRSNQLSRRNLTPAWKVELALGNKADLVEIGKRKMAEGGQGLSNLDKPSHDTRQVIADLAGVAPATIARSEYVKARAPELWEQAKAGEATIGGAYTQAKREERESCRERRRQDNAAKVEAAPDPIAAGMRFSTLLIDPPWDWGDEGDVNQMGRAKPDYATLPLADLLALKVADLADADAHLYLWATNRSLPKTFDLLTAWGFRYVTLLTWPKPSFGMGNYFRGQTEHLLFGVRGSLLLKRKDAATLLPAWNRGPGGHSSKPPEIYPFIESCSPGPYLELFSRVQREGWRSWGEDSR